jgi:hypothetical protein
LLNRESSFIGDEFGGVTDKSYSFSLPNLISAQPVKLSIALVGKSNTFGSTFTVSTDNASNVNSIFIPNINSFFDIPDAGVFCATTVVIV